MSCNLVRDKHQKVVILVFLWYGKEQDEHVGISTAMNETVKKIFLYVYFWLCSQASMRSWNKQMLNVYVSVRQCGRRCSSNSAGIHETYYTHTVYSLRCCLNSSQQFTALYRRLVVNQKKNVQCIYIFDDVWESLFCFCSFLMLISQLCCWTPG